MSLGFVQHPRLFGSPPQTVTVVNQCAIEDSSRERTIPKVYAYLWKWFVFSFVTIVPTYFIVVSTVGLHLEKEHSFIPPIVATLVIFNTVLSWLRNMLSMNLFLKRRRIPSRMFAVLFYIMGGVCWISSSFATMRMESVLQIASSLCGSIVTWIGFITLFNGNLAPPTRQQMTALSQILLAALNSEIRVFLINTVLADEEVRTNSSCPSRSTVDDSGGDFGM